MKLVRGRIPEIVAAKGEHEPFRQVKDWEEHNRLLNAKLDEELAEWREAHDPRELADLLEVIQAIAIHRGIGWAHLQALAADKRNDCGSLLDGVVWMGE